MIYGVVLTAYDPAIAGTKTLRHATQGGVYSGNYFEPKLKQAGNYTNNLFQPGATRGQSEVGHGEIVLQNLDGELDGLLDYGMDGRSAVIYKIVAGALVLLTACSMEQPVVNGDDIVIRIKDPSARLSVPIQPTKYGGTNVLPDGYDGTSDIAGKPKPLFFGPVYNATPVCVNTSRLIYQGNELTAAIPAVYDKGVLLTAGAAYATPADMQANEPAPNTYRVLSHATGTFFRLGSSPVGAITFDGIEGATAADRTAAQTGKRIASRAIAAGDIYAADVAALDAANSAEVGIFISQEMTVAEALDQVLGSVGAWYAFDSNTKLRMAQLTAATGAPDFTLTTDDYESLEIVASNDFGRGVPPYKVNLSYQKNYTVQNTGELAGSVNHDTDWVKRYLPSSAQISSIAYGNGIFMALGWGTNNYFISVNGSDWTEYAFPAGDFAAYAWTQVTYGNGLFVLKSYVAGPNHIKYSSDGITWSNAVALPNGYNWADLSWVFDRFFISTGYRLMYSTDLVNWTLSDTTATSYTRPAFGAGLFVRFGGAGGTDVKTSPDAITWTLHAAALPIGVFYPPVFGNNIFFVNKLGTANGVVSADGIAWSQVALPIANSYGVLQFFQGAFYLASGIENRILKSPDGSNWTSAYLTFPSGFWSAAASGNQVIIVSPTTSSNWVLMFSENALSDRAVWLSKEFRTVSESDNAVLTKHLLAPEMNVTTLLANEADAIAETARLLNLYKSGPRPYSIRVKSDVLPYVDLGKKGLIYSRRYGMSGGKMLRVIGLTIDYDAGITTLLVWG